MIERNTKEIFLHGLEDWISEVVKDKTNGHNAGIAPIIKDGFNSSMHANMDYHKAVADTLNKNADKKLVVYHTLMSNAYGALLTEK